MNTNDSPLQKLPLYDQDNIDFEVILQKLPLWYSYEIRIPSRLRMDATNAADVWQIVTEYTHTLIEQSLGTLIYKIFENIKPDEYLIFFEDLRAKIAIALDKSIANHNEALARRNIGYRNAGLLDIEW